MNIYTNSIPINPSAGKVSPTLTLHYHLLYILDLENESNDKSSNSWICCLFPNNGSNFLAYIYISKEMYQELNPLADKFSPSLKSTRSKFYVNSFFVCVYIGFEDVYI